MKIAFNDELKRCDSIEALGVLLDEFDQEAMFELWIQIHGGAFDEHAAQWPECIPDVSEICRRCRIYIPRSSPRPGKSTFRLANGQIDEYPLSWCIDDLEQCYNAIGNFFVNEGAKPEWIRWHED